MSGKADEAMLTLSQLLKTGVHDAEQVQAALMAADLQLAKGDTVQALQSLESVKGSGSKLASEVDAQRRSLLLKLGDALLSQKRLAEALKVLESARGETDDPALLYRQGRCLYELGRYAEAITTFETIETKFTDFPKRDNVLYALIVANVALKQPDKALKRCEQFSRSHPDSENASAVAETHGMLLHQTGDAKGAADHFAKAIASPKADHERLRFLRGNVLFGAARHTEAVAEFQALLKDFPKSTYAEEAEYRIALSSFYQNDEASTEKTLKHYIQRHPKGLYIIDARYRLAYIAFKPGMTLEAARAVVADLQ